MVLRDKILFTIASIIVIICLLRSVGAILTPFISAIVIAYFLNPLVSKLERRKLPRSFSSLLILSIFISIIAIFALLFIPIIYSEFINLLNSIPEYLNKFYTDFYPEILLYLNNLGYEPSNDLKEYLSQENISKIFNLSNDLIGGLMKSSISVINILSLIFITPILVFYLLKDWNVLIYNVDKYLPNKYNNKIRKIFINIDEVLSGYIHGQVNVCIILGFLYAAGLAIIGLNFGMMIGFLTGVMSFLPYIGMLIGVLVAIIVGLFQWGFDFTQIGLVILVFILGQIIESNFLTPRLIGQKIGIHPAWLIFAIFAFGILFGAFGVLLAVPMAAILGVLIKFTLFEYKKIFVK